MFKADKSEPKGRKSENVEESRNSRIARQGQHDQQVPGQGL
jgi:hypothetical protein